MYNVRCAHADDCIRTFQFGLILMLFVILTYIRIQLIRVTNSKLSLGRYWTSARKNIRSKEQQACLLPQLGHKEGQPHL